MKLKLNEEEKNRIRVLHRNYSVIKEVDEAGRTSDGDLSFVNKWVFTSPKGDKYQRKHLTIDNWEAFDDRQRIILMDKAEKISTGTPFEDA